jgi:hypothetical protein
MWQGSLLNWSSILKVSLIHFLAVTLVSTIVTLLIGPDNLDEQLPIDLLFYFKFPEAFISLIVLVIYAKNQTIKTIKHLIFVVAISSFIGFAIFSGLVGEVFFSPTWVVDLPIALITIFVASFIGSYFRSINIKAT